MHRMTTVSDQELQAKHLRFSGTTSVRSTRRRFYASPGLEAPSNVWTTTDKQLDRAENLAYLSSSLPSLLKLAMAGSRRILEASSIRIEGSTSVSFPVE